MRFRVFLIEDVRAEIAVEFGGANGGGGGTALGGGGGTALGGAPSPGGGGGGTAEVFGGTGNALNPGGGGGTAAAFGSPGNALNPGGGGGGKAEKGAGALSLSFFCLLSFFLFLRRFLVGGTYRGNWYFLYSNQTLFSCGRGLQSARKCENLSEQTE